MRSRKQEQNMALDSICGAFAAAPSADDVVEVGAAISQCCDLQLVVIWDKKDRNGYSGRHDAWLLRNGEFYELPEELAMCLYDGRRLDPDVFRDSLAALEAGSPMTGDGPLCTDGHNIARVSALA